MMTTREIAGRRVRPVPPSVLSALILCASLLPACAAREDAAPAQGGGGAAAATLVRPQADVDAAWAQAQTIADDMYASNKSAVYGMFHDVPVSSSWWDWAQDSLAYMNGVMASTSDFESRLGIRELRLLDGPVTCGGYQQGCTIFPAPVAVAASWDVDQAVAMYAAQGAEKKGKGANVSLSPTMNIIRDPRGGRNFESFSEDPLLSAQLAAAAVTGIQSNHIIATAKHYVDNDQETNRNTITVSIDERTQHEIYLAPFQAAVAAGAGAVMCSYNQIANPSGGAAFGCENAHTLKDLLKGELGFRGFVMSDWGATHSGATAANAGLDVEMNDNKYFGNLNGQISDATAREMARRIVFAHLVTGLDQNPVGKITKAQGVQTKVVSTAANRQVAQQTAEQSIVLLKNAGVLPLSKSATGVAVFGQCAESSYVFQGGGSASGDVTGKTIVTPRAAIAGALGVATSAIPYGTESNLSGAVSLARGKAAAIVVLCQSSEEGKDRGGLGFGAANTGGSSSNSDALVTQIAATGTPTIVMVVAPAQVAMPWANNTGVKAILWSGFLGEMEGPAIARVLFGDVNPSGKLPITFGSSLSDYPTASSAYGSASDLFPGNGTTVYYREALDVGYRHFDAKNVIPLYPFGHGLSYTTFAYANLSVPARVNAATGESIAVALDVSNTGARAGAEVVQVYLGFPSTAGEPPKVLRGFQKVALAAGQTQRVTFTLGADAYRIWNNGWAPVLGTYQVMVGASSRDIRLTGTVQVDTSSTTVWPVTVTRGGTGTGTVSSTPSGVACGATCERTFASGTVVTLSAVADAGSAFTGWSGACAGTAATCTVTVSAATAVTATFSGATVSYTLGVTRSGTGSGRVTSPAGLDCGATCSITVPSGAVVTLTATPDSGSGFGGWGGSCGTALSCAFTVTGNLAITAQFTSTPVTYPLTVSKSGSGTGTVSAAGGISCGSTCSASYAAGALVTLTAAAGSGSAFGGWSGPCTGTAATCTVTVSAATTVGAAFTGTATTPCANPVTFSFQSGNFNTTGAVCLRTASAVNGWGCSNFDGRTVKVNDGTATSSCGAGPFPLAKWSDGYTYFSVSAGTYAWASLYFW
jgi:beta-glucosidase